MDDRRLGMGQSEAARNIGGECACVTRMWYGKAGGG